MRKKNFVNGRIEKYLIGLLLKNKLIIKINV